MKKAKDYRVAAQENCSKYTKTLIIITIITIIINLVINYTVKEKVDFEGYTFELTKQPLSFLALLISGPLSVGWASVCKKVHNKGALNVGDIFNGFTKKYFRNAWAYIIQSVYLVLWGIISFGIVSIVKSFSYAITYYILEDDPSISANEAITLSRRMMDGKKWRLFCLLISYLGWMILCALTLGILSLWVVPRIEQAMYSFYIDCKK
jgi:uncharacterized membrane protein